MAAKRGTPTPKKRTPTTKKSVPLTKKGAPSTVDEYFSQYPAATQKILVKIRAVIKKAAPKAEEKISYGMPAYFLGHGLIWFGVAKKHIGFYPLTTDMENSIEGLAAYKGTKSSVHFKFDEPMPYDLLTKMVKFRIKENTKQY